MFAELERACDELDRALEQLKKAGYTLREFSKGLETDPTGILLTHYPNGYMIYPDKIIQVNYRSQGRILPRSLVNLIRIDHIPVRVMGQQYPCRVRLKALGELAQGVSCLLELFKSPIELVTGPLQLRKHLPSIAISHRISALGSYSRETGFLAGISIP